MQLHALTKSLHVGVVVPTVQVEKKPNHSPGGLTIEKPNRNHETSHYNGIPHYYDKVSNTLEWSSKFKSQLAIIENVIMGYTVWTCSS